MPAARYVIFFILAVILGVPLLLRPAADSRPSSAQTDTLIIVTPHVQQIRYEFARAFDVWYRARTGRHAEIDWRSPGGTSEIIKQLEAMFIAAAKDGSFDFTDPANPTAKPATIPFDLMFGGGSFDHTRLKTGVRVPLGPPGQDGKPSNIVIPMSIPAGFTREQLDAWFGENRIGAQTLYDPGDSSKGDQGQFWIGTALSGFGIVYNRDVLARLGLPEPADFDDLADPRYSGAIALADPRQSGSVTTTFDSILSNYGWERGWRVLREMTANTRYFTNSSTKPPIDISQGEAAAGLAIDFYGRGQAQGVLAPGQDPATSRVGYIDPKGSVYIDADPVSMLRGGPNPALAKLFIEFCLTDEAQAIWQMRSQASPGGANNPPAQGAVARSDGRLGPLRYELRRMPVRRDVYARYAEHFIDRVDPFELASDTRPRGWRPAIGLMMGAFAIDTANEQRAAWKALNAARSDPTFPSEVLARMNELFYAWPPQLMPDGSKLEFTEANFRAIREVWRSPTALTESRIAFTEFFRRQYRGVIELAETRRFDQGDAQ